MTETKPVPAPKPVPRPEPVAEADLQQVSGGMTPEQEQAWLDRWTVATWQGER